MRVRALLEFHGELRGGRNVTAEVNAWLERLGLAQRADDKVETLSKGMSQKVQFIATVIPEPKLLILDEPFTGLDPVSADSIRGAVLEMRKRGCTVILSTHDMGVAESLCDSIFMIFRGKKVLDGTLASIQSSYGSDTIRVEVEGGAYMLGNQLGELPGIERIKDMGQIQELRMAEGCDPQQVLRTLAARARITSFSVVRPSLHDIFVRIAGPQPEEAPVE
jgi:ABC-2 type transport system ATP-binding protein